MTRRDVLTTAAGAGAVLTAAEAASKNAYFELRYYRMRNSPTNQLRRTQDFLGKAYLPAARRAGIHPVGFFNAVIAPGSPFILSVSSCPSLAAIETAREKLAADSEYQKALAEYNGGELAYSRMESTLLRAFDTVPGVEMPPSEANRAARTFELRTYESNNETTLRRKIKMFDDAEVGIFRRCGLQPVFFGETIFGANMPSLTYMVAYENMAGRDKAWQAFGADPEWQKLRARPELSDPEIVCNISNAILRPLASSEIR